MELVTCKALHKHFGVELLQLKNFKLHGISKQSSLPHQTTKQSLEEISYECHSKSLWYWENLSCSYPSLTQIVV